MRGPLAIVVASLIVVGVAVGAGVAVLAGGDGLDEVADEDLPVGAVPGYQELPEYQRATEPCDAPPVHDIGPPTGPVPFRLARVTAATAPTVLAPTADGGLLIGERTGEILRWEEGFEPELVLDLSDDTAARGDQGLLGMTVGPDGRWLYTHRTDGDGANRIDAWPLVDGVPGDDGEEILTVEQPGPLHNGGDLVFAPDGTLFVSLGDGGGMGDWFHNAQDLSTPLGALLRLEPRPGEDPGYAIPADNPFVGDDSVEPLIWASGVRNPFRFSLDAETGELWLTDFGQGCVEEIDVLTPGEAGANLGWSVFEGDVPFMGSLDPGEHRPPDFTYWHTDGYCGVIGGHVYRGDAIPALAGSYVFGDFCRGEVLVMDPDRRTVRRTGLEAPSMTDVTAGPDGELWVASMAGPIYRLRPA